jgi:hypothetical protein
MFRFFKGKWVGEDELKENEKLIFQEKTGLINIINDKQRMILELKEEIVKLKFENKKLKEEVEFWKKEFECLKETLEMEETERLKGE